MVRVTFVGDALHLEIQGADKFWSIKSTIDIPVQHISGATLDPAELHDWWKGLKVAGTQFPGLMAGTFYYHGRSIFWDVRNPTNSIGIMLHDEHYSELVIEVENPADVVEMINKAIPGSF